MIKIPAGFNWCAKQKGRRIRTKKLSKNRYMRICYYRGKSYAGEVKAKKGKK